MKFFLTWLLFGLLTPGAYAAVWTKPFIAYAKLVSALDADPTYARLVEEETVLHEAILSGDAAKAAIAQEWYVSLQRRVLKLFGADFAKLAVEFAHVYPEAVLKFYAGGTRVTFKPGHPLARAFALDPLGVDHPWAPFRYVAQDQTFLAQARAFIGASAFTLLDAFLREVDGDPEFTRIVVHGNTFASLPEELAERYRPTFEALNYAFRRRDDGMITRTVELKPRSTLAPGFVIQDSLANVLDFGEATKNFPQTVEMLRAFARDAVTCERDIAS